MSLPVQTADQFRPIPDRPLTDVPWPERSRKALEMLNVERSPRYTPGQRLEDGKVLKAPKATWCNVYVTDYVRLMGIDAPRHWMTSKGEPAAQGRGQEMRANMLVDWFAEHGGRYGWASADATTAQNAAQRGHVVIVGWKNPKPLEPGHVAVVLGRDRISQAGRTNHFICTVRMGFGDVKPLVWYVQMDRPGGHNS